MSTPDFIHDAISQIAEMIKPRFAVTIKSDKISKKMSTEVRFDPSLPKAEQNKLVLVNGKAPSLSELEEFERKAKGNGGQKEEEAADEGGFNVAVDVNKIEKFIDSDSFREVKSSQANELAYEFDLRSDNFLLSRVVKQVAGTFFFDTKSKGLRRVTLRNKKTISVIPSVTIKHLDAEARFEPAGPDGELVAVSSRYKLLGKKLIVSKIWEENETSYTDYAVAHTKLD